MTEQEIGQKAQRLRERLELQQWLARKGHAQPRALAIIAEGYQKEAHALLAQPCTPEQRERLRSFLVDAACLEAEARGLVGAPAREEGKAR